MKLKQMYPDYQHCIVGIPNTLLHYYGAKAKPNRLPRLEQALARRPKNVVLIIIDGMGIDMMQHQLNPFSFLRRHIKDKITSVFPSTTVAATTSYYSGLTPIEHAWLGWAPYFPEVGRPVEMYTNKDYYTGEPIDKNFAATLPWRHIFDQIKEANANIQTTGVFPGSFTPGGVADFPEACERIIRQSKCPGEQFILAYWGEPDHTSHDFGPYSKEVKTVLTDINRQIQKMCSNLTDTLVIVSADHGHIENKHEVAINDYPELLACLDTPLCLDMRAQTIKVKPDKEKEFVTLFRQYLDKDFILMKSADAINSGLFGPEKPHERATDILGDYLIIAKSDKMLVQHFPNDLYEHLPGVHSGLTNKEMLVPLILITNL